MAQCLVTKLKGVVNDDTIMHLGEFRIKISRVETPTGKTQGLNVRVNKEVTLEIIGDGYFTDSTLVQNKGKVLKIPASTAGIGTNIYYSNGDYEIGLTEKYSLSGLQLYSTLEGSIGTGDMSNKSMSIDDLAYSELLSSISLASVNVSGNLSAFKGKNALNSINLMSSQVEGNISALKDCLSLSGVILNNTLVTGDISACQGLTALVNLNLSATKVYGDIASLVNLKNLSTLYLSGCGGNLSSLSGLSKLTVCSLQQCSVEGDLALLPSSCYFASLLGYAGSGLSWTTRPSSYNILAIEGSPNILNLDKMLQDQSQCTKPSAASGSTLYSTITASGNRTTASDSAISTLQEKGYTVVVPVATDAASVMTMVARVDAENFGIAYKDGQLVVGPVDLSKQRIYPAPGVTVETFATKEEAERFIKDKGLNTERNIFWPNI